jgi:hypothetical protein
MVQKHSLTMYQYQSGLTRDDRYEPARISPHISHFARNSQVFIKAKACFEHLETEI